MNKKDKQMEAKATEKTEEKIDKKAEKKAAAEKDLAEKDAVIAELNDKLAREHNDYLRLMAEFQTFRTRTVEEKVELRAIAAASTIEGLLPVLDDCERAMKMLESSSDEAAKEGTSLIYNKLIEYLKKCGLEEIDAKGKDFDTDYHEAVTQFPAPSPELKNKVIDVVQTGYTLHGRVLRYAKVIVGA